MVQQQRTPEDRARATPRQLSGDDDIDHSHANDDPLYECAACVDDTADELTAYDNAGNVIAVSPSDDLAWHDGSHHDCPTCDKYFGPELRNDRGPRRGSGNQHCSVCPWPDGDCTGRCG